jgi:hypothetical protein
MPVALMTSTMKSEPGRAIIFSLGRSEPLSETPLAFDCAAWLVAAIRVLIAAAAAVTAAPFKNARRSICLLLMISS